MEFKSKLGIGELCRENSGNLQLSNNEGEKIRSEKIENIAHKKPPAVFI